MNVSSALKETTGSEREPLTAEQRRAILGTAANLVETRIWDPDFDRARWRDWVTEAGGAATGIEDPAAFESCVNSLVQKAAQLVRAPSDDIGFFHDSHPRRRRARGAPTRFQYCEPRECSPAQTAASEGGDVLYSRLEGGIGWLKVTKFMGAVGVDVANEISRAISELKNCGRLVVDLRGNAGGGLGFLRLASYLTPDRLTVGYSITRRGAESGIAKEKLKAFDWIPKGKWALGWLAVKYGFGDQSVRIVTEGMKSMIFHGRTVVLIDENTTGAGERIAAFAAENRLAPIVGAKSAGRLICSDWVKVGFGYYLRIPARAWYTGNGQLLEGRGIVPNVEVASPPEAQDSEDPALREASEVVRGL